MSPLPLYMDYFFMSKIAYPSLSSSGYITDPKKLLSLMFNDALILRHNDTNLYRNNVFNIPKLVAKHGRSPQDFIEVMRSGLTSYLKPAFDSVKVIIDSTDENAAEYSLNIDLTVTSGGQTITLVEVLFINPDESTAKIMSMLGE